MKTKILILSLVCSGLFAVAQQKKINYTISGNIADFKKPYIYFGILNGKRDSIAVKDGKFNYNGSLDEPAFGYLLDYKYGVQWFFFENGTIEISGNANAFADVNINGGKIQAEWNRLEKNRKELRAEGRALSNKARTANMARDFTTQAVLDDQKAKVDVKINAIGEAFIAKNPKSYVSLAEVWKRKGDETDYHRYKLLYEKLDPSLKNTAIAKDIEAGLAFLKRSLIGEKMDDFTQNDPSGKPVSLSSFRGKYVLVDFWAAWCGPCRAENPNILKVYQQFSNQGFTVLGVSSDRKAEDWKKAIEEDKIPWTQVSDLGRSGNAVARYFGVRYLPSNFLLDPNGIIIARDLMGADLENKLKEIFNK